MLERVHVFVKRGSEREFPDLTLTLQYQFVHVLYQNVLYASLQPTRRAALSGRVARALVAHGEETPANAARLAVLFEAARDFATSARYYFVAAQHSAGLFAFREALSLAERGLEGAARRCPTVRRAQQQELGLQMIRGLALRMMKGWAAPSSSPCSRARASCATQLDDPPEVFPVRWALTLFHAIRGDLRVYRERAAGADDPGRAVRQSRVPDGRASPGRRLAGVPRRHGRVEPGARSRARAARARRAHDLHGDVRPRPRHDRPRDVEPAALGAGLSGSRRPARARDAGAGALAASADDARLRARRRAGHPPLSRRGGRGGAAWATRSSRSRASTS